MKDNSNIVSTLPLLNIIEPIHLTLRILTFSGAVTDIVTGLRTSRARIRTGDLIGNSIWIRERLGSQRFQLLGAGYAESK
jgi:hypothetical protein